MIKTTKAGHSRGVRRLCAIRQGLPSVSGELLGIWAYPKELLEGGLSVSMMREGEREKSRIDMALVVAVGTKLHKKSYMRWRIAMRLKTAIGLIVTRGCRYFDGRG
jgi:hypothetical protein